ncbi:MAG TPA: hypothetical protein VKT52_03885 [Ktedonobacterales bacterium]|nr:hypothetical protein [Ktedonobacterales bacterium]
MAVAQTPYVEERAGVLYVGATRVTVSSLIAAWRNEGYTAEELQLGFPATSLAQVYGTIAYYLDHQAELDRAFADEDARYQQQRSRDRDADPTFYQRLEERRTHLRQRLTPPDASDGV